MAQNLYELRYFSPFGERLGNLDIFSELEFGRQKNDIGVAALTLPGNIYNNSIFKKDSILEIWRYNPRTGELTLVGKTCWFLRSVKISIGNGGEKTVELFFFDTMHLLGRRHNMWYNIEDPIASGVLNYPSRMVGNIDNLIKAVFYHNCGAGVFTAYDDFIPIVSGPALPPFITLFDQTLRVMPIELDNFTGEAPVSELTMAYTNLLEIFKSACDTSASLGTELWFDVEYTSTYSGNALGQFIFKTYANVRGVDRTYENNPTDFVVVSHERGNLLDTEYTLNWEEEKTLIYAVGTEEPKDGDGVDEDPMAYAPDPPTKKLPFYPIEGLIQAENNEQTGLNLDLFVSQAEAELYRTRPKISLSGKILNNFGTLFMFDYDYGDRITGEFEQTVFSITVDKFKISVDDSGIEEIEVSFATDSYLLDETI